MSDKVRRQVEVERQNLQHLLAVHNELLTKCEQAVPTAVERSALVAMLHSFYSGIENILERICRGIDGVLPDGAAWHQELLSVAMDSTECRPAIISASTYGVVIEYLQFRHFFRRAYTFDLDWEEMSGLVLHCRETLSALEQDLDRFLDQYDDSEV